MFTNSLGLLGLPEQSTADLGGIHSRFSVRRLEVQDQVSAGLDLSEGLEGRICFRPHSLAVDGVFLVFSHYLPSACVQFSFFHKDIT